MSCGPRSPTSGREDLRPPGGEREAGKLSIVIATTMGPKNSADVAYSTILFKELVKLLAPDAPAGITTATMPGRKRMARR